MNLVAQVVLFTGIIGTIFARNEPCFSIDDCVDSGTTCRNGICMCWFDMGFSTALTWACDSDQGCQVLFPGHVCKPSSQCQPFRSGYCQPIRAAQKGKKK